MSFFYRLVLFLLFSSIIMHNIQSYRHRRSGVVHEVLQLKVVTITQPCAHYHDYGSWTTLPCKKHCKWSVRFHISLCYNLVPRVLKGFPCQKTCSHQTINSTNSFNYRLLGKHDICTREVMLQSIMLVANHSVYYAVLYIVLLVNQ